MMHVPATRLDIITNTSEAYNLVTQGGGGGGGGGVRGGGGRGGGGGVGGGCQGIQPRSQQVGGSHKDAYEVLSPSPLQSSQCQRGARAAAGAGGTGEEEGIYEEIII